MELCNLASGSVDLNPSLPNLSPFLPCQVKCPASMGRDLLDPELQIQAFECRAAAVLAQASQVLTVLHPCQLT